MSYVSVHSMRIAILFIQSVFLSVSHVVVLCILLLIIIGTFVTRLLQLKNEPKCYICYGKIDKNR